MLSSARSHGLTGGGEAGGGPGVLYVINPLCIVCSVEYVHCRMMGKCRRESRGRAKVALSFIMMRLRDLAVSEQAGVRQLSAFFSVRQPLACANAKTTSLDGVLA